MTNFSNCRYDDHAPTSGDIIRKIQEKCKSAHTSFANGMTSPKVSPQLVAATTMVICFAAFQKQSPKLLTGSEIPVIDADRVVDVTDETPSTNPFDGMVDPAQQKKVSTNPFDINVEKLVIPEEISISGEEPNSTNPFDGLDENSHYQPTEKTYSPGFDWKSEWTSDGHDEFTASATKKGLLERLSQHKVAIAAGSALTILASGGAAAYFFYPVATAAHIASAVEFGSAAAMGAHMVLIQPGLVNTMLVANLLMKVAVVPAAQVSATVILPMISTAVGLTLGAFALLYIGNKVWEASKFAMYHAGSAVAHKFGEQLDKTYAGQAVKFAALTVADPYIGLLEGGKEVDFLEETSDEQSLDMASTTSQKAENSEEEMFTSESTTTERIKAQKKTKRTFRENCLRAGLMTAGLGLGGYFVYKMRQG